MTSENGTAAGVLTDGGQRRDSGRGATTGKRSMAGRQLVATYYYRDDGGAEIYRKQRYEWQDATTGKRRKSCRYQSPDGHGGWIDGLGNTRRVLYRLPELTDADPGEVIFYVEGEKCVERLRALGVIVTTAGGADDWRPGFERWLAGRDVVILPDNNDPGSRHGEQVANALSGIARRVRVVELPGLPDGGDIVDFLDAGHTIEELAALVDAAEPWAPPMELSAPSTSDGWPVLDPAAYCGLAGEAVQLIEPATEADPAAILAQLLVAFGNVVGRGPHWQVEAITHYSVLFAVIVGDTSNGRKGVGWGHVENLLRGADPEWRVHSGLSSGEGVISLVRDPVEKWNVKEQEFVVDDPGVEDKRALVQESEFAVVLHRLPREGNSLSPIIRDCWDGKTLQTITRAAPLKASEPHVSIIGHITPAELRRYLDRTEFANGFANRFLFIGSRRSKALPHGGCVDEAALERIRVRIKAAVDHARTVGHVPFDSEAHDIWTDIYPNLTEARTGIFGAVTARAAPQVRRLALVYALMDRSSVVTADHLQAAVALWEYAEGTCRYVFGRDSGDPDAERLFAAIVEAGRNGLTRSQLQERVGRNWTADRLDRAVGVLHRADRISVESKSTKGRPALVYRVKP